MSPPVRTTSSCANAGTANKTNVSNAKTFFIASPLSCTPTKENELLRARARLALPPSLVNVVVQLLLLFSQDRADFRPSLLLKRIKFGLIRGGQLPVFF